MTGRGSVWSKFTIEGRNVSPPSHKTTSILKASAAAERRRYLLPGIRAGRFLRLASSGFLSNPSHDDEFSYEKIALISISSRPASFFHRVHALLVRPLFGWNGLRFLARTLSRAMDQFTKTGVPRGERKNHETRWRFEKRCVGYLDDSEKYGPDPAFHHSGRYDYQAHQRSWPNGFFAQGIALRRFAAVE